MTIEVIDNKDIDALAANARGEPIPVKAETPKEEPKVEEPKEVLHETPVEPPDEDKEGEDGLTPKQKRELTQKMQIAIGKKHRALKDAEEFATEQYNERRMAEQRAENYEKELQQLKTQIQPVKAEDERPQREKFETEQEYLRADARWEVRQEIRVQREQEAQAKEAVRQEEVRQAAIARRDHAIEVVPDFEEVTSEATVPVPAVVGGYLQESEMFAELVYHFAKHPEEMEKLARMTPARSLVELGKIESKLVPFPAKVAEKESQGNGAKTPSTDGVIPPKPTDRSPSKPRAPITPIGSVTAGQVEKDEREMSAAEALQAWSKKHHANFYVRKRH